MAAGKPGKRLLNLRVNVVGLKLKPRGSCGSWVRFGIVFRRETAEFVNGLDMVYT